MISKLINPIIYILFLAGVFLVFYNTFEMYFRKIKRKNLLKKKLQINISSKGISNYIDDMLAVVIKNKKINSTSFIVISISIFFLIFILTFPVMYFKAVLPSVFFSALPFIVLRFRLENRRNKGSKEAEKLVSGLLNSYRANHRNIFSAMEIFIRDEASECNITGRLMFQLLMDIRNTKNPDNIRKATEKFAFGVKTNWSYMLSQCIFAAAYEGIDISESMEDILEQLKTAKILDEERKRANSESSRLVKFIVPIAYVSSIGISVSMMDIPLSKVIRNQFLDAAGIGLLFLIVSLFIINLIVLETIKNGKFDY